MSASSPSLTQPPGEEEPSELVKFREEWLAELRRRKASPDTNVPASVGTPDIPSIPTDSGTSKVPGPSHPLPATHPALSRGEILPQSHVSTTLENALSFYRQAVEHEQRSDLDQALQLYRQAFRLDDNVDRAYRREQMLQSIIKEQQDAASPKHKDVETLSPSLKNVDVQPKAFVTGTRTLANFLEGIPADVNFEPENENDPVLLNLLPNELLLLIVGKMDATSIERLASVCKKARVLTLDRQIWRTLVVQTYRPPQIPDYDSIVPIIERCALDYRRVYIEQPRVRLDGVYIATCHYVRPGLSENSWVNVSHLITYHRYLRFFPNGQVLSLLANDEHSPQQVIPLLKYTLRMKGLFLGHWKLIETTVHLSNLVDASGRFALPLPGETNIPPPPTHPTSSSTSASGSARARYAFAMTLTLRSRPLGRWNKMDIETYDSVNIETGDVNPVALKHERPFWFSKVRSYVT